MSDRPWKSVCQIDLELQLVLWKQSHIPLQRTRGARSGQKMAGVSNFRNMGSVKVCPHVDDQLV